jgi:hypothetical protein
MLRTFIVATSLLLLATAQTLAVNCDLRCSSMLISSAGQECGGHWPMATCHGKSGDGDRFIHPGMSGSQCGATLCKTELYAIYKSSAADESSAKSVAVLIPVLSIPVAAGMWTQSSMRRSPDRQHASAPLDSRPGSSLRI